jgi:acyl transferase domain-containing protein
VPISARTAEQLEAYARRLLAFLEDSAHAAAPPALADIAYTFQVGREPLAHRAALCARSCDELARQLRQLAAGDATIAGGYRGRVTGAAGIADVADVADVGPGSGEADDVEAIARCWAAGGDVAWPRRSRGEPAGRISLPTYPFAKRRHWVPRIRGLYGRAGVRTSAAANTAATTAANTAATTAANTAATTAVPGAIRDLGPGDDLERTVVRVLAQTLKVDGDHLETDLSLMDLGADSIVMLQVLDDLEQATGARLSPSDFVAPPSARMIVQEIARNHGDTWRAHAQGRAPSPAAARGSAEQRSPELVELAALADQILAGAMSFEHALETLLR